MKVGITTDCSSCIEYAPFKHNVKVTRTTIHFGEKEFVDGVDINADQFYEKLSNSDIVPSTSAPSPEQLIGKAEEYMNAGYTDVIHFPISFGLSAYGENLKAVSDDYVEGINYHVYNPMLACMPQGYTAHYAQILADKGATVDEIFAECDKLRHQAVEYFIVDDLKYLVKNGRLSVAAGAIGSLMKIKPILRLGEIEEGKINTFEKVRTSSKVIDRIFELVHEETKDAKEVIYCIQHTLNAEKAKELQERAKQEFSNGVAFPITVVAPTVGCHIGCGILSLGYIILDGLKEKDLLK